MKLLFIVALLTLVGCGQATNETPTASTAPPPQTPTVTQLSQKASGLKLGMTPKQVLQILGKSPDTVVTDSIRKELGEPVSGFPNLITYEWANGGSCQPVSVDFDRKGKGLVATGWNEGQVCTGTSGFNEPFGKSCKKNPLCKI